MTDVAGALRLLMARLAATEAQWAAEKARADKAEATLALAGEELADRYDAKQALQNAEAERDEARAEAEQLREDIADGERERDALRAALAASQARERRALEVVRGLSAHVERSIEAAGGDGGSGDWACAECRPHSDMLRAGFRCYRHEALALLAEEVEP